VTPTELDAYKRFFDRYPNGCITRWAGGFYVRFQWNGKEYDYREAKTVGELVERVLNKSEAEHG
jgi:hypothetical protein